MERKHHGRKNARIALRWFSFSALVCILTALLFTGHFRVSIANLKEGLVKSWKTPDFETYSEQQSPFPGIESKPLSYFNRHNLGADAKEQEIKYISTNLPLQLPSSLDITHTPNHTVLSKSEIGTLFQCENTSSYKRKMKNKIISENSLGALVRHQTTNKLSYNWNQKMLTNSAAMKKSSFLQPNNPRSSFTKMNYINHIYYDETLNFITKEENKRGPDKNLIYKWAIYRLMKLVFDFTFVGKYSDRFHKYKYLVNRNANKNMPQSNYNYNGNILSKDGNITRKILKNRVIRQVNFWSLWNMPNYQITPDNFVKSLNNKIKSGTPNKLLQSHNCMRSFGNENQLGGECFIYQLMCLWLTEMKEYDECGNCYCLMQHHQLNIPTFIPPIVFTITPPQKPTIVLTCRFDEITTHPCRQHSTASTTPLLKRTCFTTTHLLTTNTPSTITATSVTITSTASTPSLPATCSIVTLTISLVTFNLTTNVYTSYNYSHQPINATLLENTTRCEITDDCGTSQSHPPTATTSLVSFNLTTNVYTSYDYTNQPIDATLSENTTHCEITDDCWASQSHPPTETTLSVSFDLTTNVNTSFNDTGDCDYQDTKITPYDWSSSVDILTYPTISGPN